jgi:hypothetical protein
MHTLSICLSTRCMHVCMVEQGVCQCLEGTVYNAAAKDCVGTYSNIRMLNSRTFFFTLALLLLLLLLLLVFATRPALSAKQVAACAHCCSLRAVCPVLTLSLQCILHVYLHTEHTDPQYVCGSAYCRSFGCAADGASCNCPNCGPLGCQPNLEQCACKPGCTLCDNGTCRDRS